MIREIQVFVTYLKNQNEKQQICHNERWESTDWFCPKCGTQQIWIQLDDQDIYLGGNCFCSACGKIFTWQNATYENDERPTQLIKQLF